MPVNLGKTKKHGELGAEGSFRPGGDAQLYTLEFLSLGRFRKAAAHPVLHNAPPHTAPLCGWFRYPQPHTQTSSLKQ
jgi:hypothetical protein